MEHKLIAFDVDGTLVDKTIFLWETIHNYVNADMEELNQIKKSYMDGKISYSNWMEHDIRIWKAGGATREMLFDAIKPLKLMENTIETLQTLKQEGRKLAIVSGSLNFVLDKLIPDYKDYFSHVLINHIYFNRQGSISGWKASEYDMENKAKGLEMIAKKENLPLKSCAFIGDNFNDIHIAQKAGFSIAFNCKSEKLAKVSDIVIYGKDLKEILDYIR